MFGTQSLGLGLFCDRWRIRCFDRYRWRLLCTAVVGELETHQSGGSILYSAWENPYITYMMAMSSGSS